MKKLSVAMATGISLLALQGQLFAQTAADTKITVIKPYVLPITFYKTTNLIFPYAIKSVDRGSKDILVQKAKDVENILQVKAGKLGFDQTNLTVITADGKLYSYILNYADSVSILNLQFDNTPVRSQNAFFENITINEAQIKADLDTVANDTETMRGGIDRSFGMSLKLKGLYIRGDVLYLRLLLRNRTNINYDIDQLRFYIRDEKKVKRTASQELEITPLEVKGDTATITGQSEYVFVYALPKFTIPDKKFLAIELLEKAGGRHLNIRVRNRTLIKARLLW